MIDRIEETSTQLEIYTTIADLEEFWGSSRGTWGLFGSTDIAGDEMVRLTRKHEEDLWSLERKSEGEWFAAMAVDLSAEYVPGIGDMHRRGMMAATCVIDAAGSQPYDYDGNLLVPAEPTLQDWQAELDDLDREELTDVEREEYLDGWADVMGRWQQLVEEADDATDATRQVAEELLEQAAYADEPVSLLQAARTLLGHSRVEMAGRMGVPGGE